MSSTSFGGEEATLALAGGVCGIAAVGPPDPRPARRTMPTAATITRVRRFMPLPPSTPHPSPHGSAAAHSLPDWGYAVDGAVGMTDLDEFDLNGTKAPPAEDLPRDPFEPRVSGLGPPAGLAPGLPLPAGG